MSLSIRYNSPVVLTFALLCTAIFYLDYFLPTQIIANYFTLSGVFDSSNPRHYFNLIGYVLGHGRIEGQPSYAHLLNNMIFLLPLGPILEEKYGSRSLLIMMIITSLITGILHVLFFDQGLLGASGIVFMFIILISFTNIKKKGIPLTFVLVLLLFIGQEILNSMEKNTTSEFAHIAGGIIGSVFGFMINNRKMQGVTTEE